MEGSIKEEYCKKYFNDIKPKHLKHFKETTPQGNIIEGFICKKPNRLLGSMVIDKITTSDGEEKEVEQFIHAMPKIHYYSYKNEMFQDKEGTIWPCYEKLDGSCLILYGIYDNDGTLIEIIPRTRGIPIADKHIIDLYNEIDHSNIEAFFDQNMSLVPTLMFELYGQLNMHSIYYPEVRISMALIGATFNGELQSHYIRNNLVAQYDFNSPRIPFSLKNEQNFWRIVVYPGIFAHYLTKDMTEAQLEGLKVEYPTQFDAITALKDYLDIINKNYSKVHNYSLTEGVCINTFDSSGDHFMYLKVKPSDIVEKAKTQEGIPRKIILKEVQKYFDEYGSQAKELYKQDEKHAYNYIMNNLSEEFDVDVLENKKTKNRVKKVFLDTLEAKQPPKGLQEICNSIVEEYPGQEAVDYIRLFAQEYPEKKRHSRMAFSIFEKLAMK